MRYSEIKSERYTALCLEKISEASRGSDWKFWLQESRFPGQKELVEAIGGYEILKMNRCSDQKTIFEAGSLGIGRCCRRGLYIRVSVEILHLL